MGRQRIIALLYGSVLAGAIITIVTGGVIYYESTHSPIPTWPWLVMGILILFFVVSIIFLQKNIDAPAPSWLAIPLVFLVIFALYLVAVFPRELWNVQILPEAILIFCAVNVIILFFRSRKREGQPRPEEDAAGKPLLMHIITLTLLTFFVPALLAGYMRFLMLPKAVFFDNARIDIEYDQPYNQGAFGVKDLGPGLYLHYGTGLRGDYGMNYELKTAAYLLSSDSENFNDTKSFVRRARFVYSLGDNSQIFYGPDGWNRLFLSYDNLVNGPVQGGFDNYKPVRLSKILSANNQTQFAVEVVATLTKKRTYPDEVYGDENKVLSQIRKVVPLSYEQISRENRGKYLKSKWAAMLKGEEWQKEGSQEDKPAEIVKPHERVVRSTGRKEPEQPALSIQPVTGNTPGEEGWEDL